MFDVIFVSYLFQLLQDPELMAAFQDPEVMAALQDGMSLFTLLPIVG